jgi:hypothetical protein
MLWVEQQQEVRTMTTTTDKCPHGRDIYTEECTRCERDATQYREAVDAVKAIGSGINGGSKGVVAAAFGKEHAYLFNELAEAIALSTLLRTEDRPCYEALNSGSTFETVASEEHPAHDGRIGCGVVVGALRALSVKRTDDVLKARKFWLDQIYGPRY